MKEESNKNRKKIRIIRTIQDREKIVSQLNEIVDNCEFEENKPFFKKDIKELEEYLSENCNNIEILSKYFTNASGKYLIYCKTSSQIRELIDKVVEVFSDVNDNIEISELTNNVGVEERQKIIDRIKNDNEKGKLKLLFATRNIAKYCDMTGFDGMALLNTNNDGANRNVEILRQAVQNLSNDTTIIQFLDHIITIRMLDTVERNITAMDGYDIEFIDTEPVKQISKVKNIVCKSGLSNRAKLDIFKEYKKTGKPIQIDSEYNGYRIGFWQFYLRQAYKNGTLSMEEDLIEEFKKEGIVGKALRKPKVKEKKKYDLIMGFNKKNPKKVITESVFDEKGNPIGRYRSQIQININSGVSKLTEKQKKQLRRKGFVTISRKEIEEQSKKYNISDKDVITITRDFDDIDEFVRLYKQGKVESNSLKLNRRGIILSENDMTESKKQNYLLLLEDVFKEDVMKDTTKFVTESDILQAFEQLTSKEKTVIMKMYGLEDDEKLKRNIEVSEELGISKQRIHQLQTKGLIKLVDLIKVESITKFRKEENELSEKNKHLKSLSDKDWENENLSIDIKHLGLKEPLYLRLKAEGYSTILDLLGASKEELMGIRSFGEGKVNSILNIVNNIKIPSKELEIEKNQKRIDKLRSKISTYDNAYRHYMEEEDIFNTNGIIPAAILEKEEISELMKLKMKKTKKLGELNEITEEIKSQDEKTEKVRKVLENNGIKLSVNDKKIGE